MNDLMNKIPTPILSGGFSILIGVPTFGLLAYLTNSSISEYVGMVIGCGIGTVIGGFIGIIVCKLIWRG